MTNPSTRTDLSPVQYALLAMFVLALLTLSAWGIYELFTSRMEPLIWDFHIPWLAVGAMLHDGANPYSEEVTLATEQQMLGRTADVSRSELRLELAYPLYVMVLIGPLTSLPLPAAQAVWFALLEASFLILILLAPRAVGWRPRPWLLGLTAIFALGLYSSAWALFLGQVSIVVAAFLALSWWGLRAERWTLSGVLLALSTMKPQMVFLFVPGVLVWAVCERHWRVVISFFITLGALILLPVPWLPTWPAAWLNAMQRYTGYTIFKPPLVMLLRLPWLAAIVAILLLAWTVERWWRAAEHNQSILDWGLGMLLVTSTLIAPRTSHVNQLALLLPLFYLFGQVSKSGIIASIEIVLLVGWWAIDLLLPPPVNGLEHMIWQHRVISPILPIGLALALLAVRPRPARGGS